VCEDSGLTLKQLEAFYWAVKLGSFADAADKLHVTQSSLSKRILELEESIGQLLFNRLGRKATATEAGEQLMEHVSKLLTQRDLIAGFSPNPEKLSGVCRFGISEFGALTWLPKFVSRVHEKAPDLVIQPYVDLASQLEQRVISEELDFAIAPGASLSPELYSERVARVECSWMAAPGLYPAGTILQRSHFESQAVITMTSDSGLTRAFDHWAASQSIKTRRQLACNSLMANAGLTAAGLGISFFPVVFMKPWIEKGLLMELRSEPPLPLLDYYFLARHGDSRRIVQMMCKFVGETIDFSLGIT